MTINKRIVFLGDSITDAGRDYTEREGLAEELGSGFVRLVQSGLKVKYPDRKYEIINRGVSGNRTPDLLERLEDDVLALTPEYVYVMIGVNDVWRHFNMPYKTIKQVSLDDYRKNYEILINKCLEHNIKVVISSCFFLDLNLKDEMRAMVDEYNECAYELALKYDLKFLDVQKCMDDFLSINSSYTISLDRVHLNHVGSHLLADFYLRDF